MRRFIQVLILALFALLVLMVLKASAQVSLSADRIFLGPSASPCTLRVGAGAPTGGRNCEFFLSTTTGDLWQNVNGEWRDVTSNPRVTTLTASTSVSTPRLASASGPITLAPANGTVLPSTNLGVSFGAPTQKFLTMHLGELWAESLVAQHVMATIGGRVVVAPTTSLVNDITAASTSITVKYNNLQVNDIIFLQDAPSGAPTIEFMRVTGGPTGPAGAHVYSVTRDIDGSGATPWSAGDAIVNTGRVGSGMIDIFALQGVLTGFGPTIVGNVRTGPNFNDISPRWAAGNLNALGWGHTSDFYGFAAGNPSGAAMYIDDQNGLVLRGAGATKVHISPAGVASFVGDGNGVTNINGGNIAADSITGLQIAANSITVGDINATGMGDNLTKNGTFESNVGAAIGDPSSLSGWALDPAQSAPGAILRNSCCGMSGPGTLLLDGGNGVTTAVYQAFPVDRTGTGKYRVSLKVYSATGSAAGYHLLMQEYGTASGGVRRVLNGGAPIYPDVLSTSVTGLIYNGPLAAGWQTLEFTYSPANSNIAWVSLAIYGLTTIHVDDVEMQKQIGPGHIRAGSITTQQLLVGPTGAALNADPNTADTTAWAPNAGLVAATFVPDGKVGTTALRNTTVFAYPWENRLIPIDFTKVYRFHVWARSGGASNGTFYAGISLFDANGAECDLNNCPTVTGRALYCVAVPAASIATWTEFTCTFNPATQVTSAARTMRPQMLLNYQGTVGYMEVQDVRIEEMVPSTLIRDGAITTDKIVANAITSTKIAANAITAVHITAGAINASHISANSITSGMIAAGQVTAEDIASGNVTADHIAARTITAGHIAVGTISATEIGAGAINASHIQAGSVTADKLNVGALSAISANLGTVTAGTISSVTMNSSNINSTRIDSAEIHGTNIFGAYIEGSAIVAGSGNTIGIGNDGISIAEGNGSGSAKIVLGSNTMYANGNRIYMNQGLNLADTLVLPTPPNTNGGNLDLWWNVNCSCLTLFQFTQTAGQNVAPYTPADPLAILRAPLKTWETQGGGRRTIGILPVDVESFLPDLVDRRPGSAIAGINSHTMQMLLLNALKTEDARIAALEARIKSLEQLVAQLTGGVK